MNKPFLLFVTLSAVFVPLLVSCPDTGSSTTTYKVTFDSGEGSTLSPQNVQSGGAVDRPANPQRSGYIFENWYSDADFQTVYDYAQPVTKNITLYARWMEIVAQELPRSDAEYLTTGLRPDDYRTNIVLFSIKAENTDNANEYRLAIRAASENTPGVEDIRSSSATIVRTVSPTSINVHMGFHMDTTLFDDNTVWDDDSNARQHNLTDAKIDEAHLQPNTAYTLYGVLENGGTEVLTLLSFNTDAYPADDIASSTFLYNFPPDKYTFTISSGEPFLIDGIFLSLQTSLFFRHSSKGNLTQLSNFFEEVNPPINTDNGLGGKMYFIPKLDLSGKSQLIAIMKNTNLNSGERFDIEYTSGSHKSTMNFIAE